MSTDVKDSMKPDTGKGSTRTSSSPWRFPLSQAYYFTKAQFAAETRRIQAGALRQAGRDIGELSDYGFTVETREVMIRWLLARAAALEGR